MTTLTAAATIKLREYGEDSFGYLMTDRSFAVCVVDGDTAAEHLQRWIRYGTPLPPPAWLTKLREPCSVLTFEGPEIHDDPRVNACPRCIDGRPAVTVHEVRGDGAEWLLGRGTVEHILPVVDDPDGGSTPATRHESYVFVGVDGTATWYRWENGKRVKVGRLDITAAPGQYVVLVRMEHTP